jgi:hypothetical protein
MPENGSGIVRVRAATGAAMTDVILLSAIALLVALLELIMLYRAGLGPAAEDQPRQR